MAEESPPVSRAGRDLIDAYRAHRGPPPEVVERLAAALRADTRPAGPSEALRAETRPPELPDASPVDLATRRRTRLRWTLAAGLLAAAALALLAVRSPRMQRHARHDLAAPFHHTPDPATPAHHLNIPAGPEPSTPDVSTVAPPARPHVREAPARVADDPAPAAPTLAEEMQHMRAAQLALAADDPTRALDLLADYVATFPDGRLREEYLALRAIALCTRDPHAGRTAAAAFLGAHPRSMFAERVRGACDAPHP